MVTVETRGAVGIQEASWERVVWDQTKHSGDGDAVTKGTLIHWRLLIEMKSLQEGPAPGHRTHGRGIHEFRPRKLEFEGLAGLPGERNPCCK